MSAEGWHFNAFHYNYDQFGFFPLSQLSYCDHTTIPIVYITVSPQNKRVVFDSKLDFSDPRSKSGIYMYDNISISGIFTNQREREREKVLLLER